MHRVRALYIRVGSRQHLRRTLGHCDCQPPPNQPKGPVWDRFSVVAQGKNALTPTVRCKYCSWEHLGHPDVALKKSSCFQVLGD